MKTEGRGKKARKSKAGVIYVRKSSKPQAEKENSLDGEVDSLTKVAKKHGIELPYSPVKDVISTKEHISENLVEILELARKGKVSYLLVTRLDRIGRNPVESMYFIHQLRELDVKIMTVNGEVDISEFRGLCTTVLECFSAAMEIRNLAERTQGGRERNFRNRKWNRPVPVGYEKDGDWLAKKPHYGQIINKIHNLYQGGESKSEIQEHVNEEYGSILDEPIKYHQIDNILTDPVYAGRPKYRNVEITDPDLRFVSDETFNLTQRKYKEKSESKKSKAEPININELVDKHGILYGEKHLPIALKCAKCGSPMDKNGIKKDRNIYKNNYICPNCGKQRAIPTAHQLDNFESADPFYCPNCGTPDELKEEGAGERFEVTCTVCGYRFHTNKSTNKFLRNAKRGGQRRKIAFDSEQLDLSRFSG